MSEQSVESDAPQRVTIYPREAAALDRLLDAYLATDEGDPGRHDLIRLRVRVERLRQNHSEYKHDEDLVTLAYWVGLDKKKRAWPCVEHADPHNFPMRHTAGPCTRVTPPGSGDS